MAFMVVKFMAFMLVTFMTVTCKCNSGLGFYFEIVVACHWKGLDFYFEIAVACHWKGFY